MLSRILLPRLHRLTLRPQTRHLSHIEEEYFEDFEAPPPTAKTTPSEDVKEGFRRARESDVDFVEHVIGALRHQKARDLFVVATEEKEMTPWSHRIICSVYNARQAAAISENLKSILRMEGSTVADGNNNRMMSHVKRTTKRSNGWFVSEIDRIQIHVMSEDCREKYELEAAWAGDDRLLEEIDEQKSRLRLPPKR